MRREEGILAGAGSKLAAEAFGRLFQFAFAYTAQVSLGPSDYGALVYALASGLVAGQFADAGLQLSVTREMARDPAAAGATARAGLQLRIGLATIAAALLALLALTRPAGIQLATWTAALSVVAATFVEYAGFAFRGLNRVIDDARLSLGLRVTTAGAGIAALSAGAGLTGVAVTLLVSTAIAAAAAGVWLHSQLPPDRAGFDSGMHRSLFAQAAPLGAAILLSVVYSRSPIFILDVVAGSRSVGLFGVAQRLIDPLAIVPAAVLAAVFPALVRESGRNPRLERALRFRTVLGLFVGGVAVGIGSFLAGPWILAALYDNQYDGAAGPLRYLGAATILTFVNYALTHFLVAYDRAATLMWVNGMVLAANVIFCTLLSSAMGPTGAALAIVLSEALLFASCLFFLARERDKSIASPVQMFDPVP